ncbi:MAG: hypothetical protein IH899_21545, partial [Planctomycetes bacterium]|nr:hypothetical protein [Planctomycetota bacterium]
TSESIAALEFLHHLDADAAKWVLGEINLVEKQDDIAIAYFEAALELQGITDTSWVRKLVTEGRDPVTGQAYLDRRIPQIVASAPEESALGWS